jgi:hypothetical protein
MHCYVVCFSMTSCRSERLGIAVMNMCENRLCVFVNKTLKTQPVQMFVECGTVAASVELYDRTLTEQDRYSKGSWLSWLTLGHAYCHITTAIYQNQTEWNFILEEIIWFWEAQRLLASSCFGYFIRKEHLTALCACMAADLWRYCEVCVCVWLL